MPSKHAKIIIVGKPNVGKSSIFNCLLRQRVAITSEVVGTTRDLNIKSIELNGALVDICDTAGILHDESSAVFSDTKARILQNIEPHDIVLYIISAKEMIDDYDIVTFRQFSNAILIVNKMDANRNEDWEYSAFGAKNVFFISALHNRGISKLKNHLIIMLENANNSIEIHESSPNLESKTRIRVGIIGRVNVGKSSILNALLKKDRALVSDVAGTTIDPVSEELEFENCILHFVDTAGIRQRSKVEGIEKYALQRTKNILEQSDIALLILDASKPFVDLDEKISGLSDVYKLGIIIVLNKWDVRYGEFERIQGEIRRKFAYLAHAPIITTSAISGRHIDKIKRTIIDVYANFVRRIPTALLNEIIENATKNHPIPSHRGKMVKIYYATQVDISPPQIVLIMNRPKSLHFSYKRYLVNWLRKHFDFSGVPIIIMPRGKDARDSDNALDSKDSNNVDSNSAREDL